jgi:hypothetical protein
MLYTLKQLETLTPAINQLFQSKPSFELRKDIKEFLSQYNAIAKDIPAKLAKITKEYNDGLKVNEGSEAGTQAVEIKLNHDMAELHAMMFELPTFNRSWLKLCELTMAQEINIDDIFNDNYNQLIEKERAKIGEMLDTDNVMSVVPAGMTATGVNVTSHNQTNGITASVVNCE